MMDIQEFSMPTLYKPKKKVVKQTDASKAYNYSWTKLRDAYIMEHPICELCEKEGRISPTQEVHHIRPISTGKNQLEMKDILLDYNNLMALCKDCHHTIHNKMRNDKQRANS